MMTNAEGRVVKHNKAQDPPPGVRTDTWESCASSPGGSAPATVRLAGSREVFDELRVASARRRHRLLRHHLRADRGDRRHRLALPVHRPPGHAPAVRGRRGLPPRRQDPMQVVEWHPPSGRRTTTNTRSSLTTGRTVAHYLCGNQTRRLGVLVEQTPQPWVEVHPSHGFRNGEAVRVVTRRGSEVFPALVAEAIRPDTVFIPYHWPVRARANALHHRALDPRSKIPEYKVCACRIEHAERIDEVPAPPSRPRPRWPTRRPRSPVPTRCRPRPRRAAGRRRGAEPP